MDVSSPERILSRHRRFLIGTSGSKGEARCVKIEGTDFGKQNRFVYFHFSRFSLLIPLEGGSVLGIRFPFSYAFDSNT